MCKNHCTGGDLPVPYILIYSVYDDVENMLIKLHHILFAVCLNIV